MRPNRVVSINWPIPVEKTDSVQHCLAGDNMWQLEQVQTQYDENVFPHEDSQ